jgi:hypothetical protein
MMFLIISFSSPSYPHPPLPQDNILVSTLFLNFLNLTDPSITSIKDRQYDSFVYFYLPNIFISQIGRQNILSAAITPQSSSALSTLQL